MSEYLCKESSAGFFEFFGPGLDYKGVAPDVRLVTSHDASRVMRMLAQAYEAGRKAKALELRLSLGIEP